ncbi:MULTISPECIES: stage VI sporulation protein D [Pontibacillus]|uniref:Stage VI sporulation protein D n=1 Tax=Pontibacillus chungwhensis TaxID=265426 RepID=A0ABY8UUM3_9BACI|nr:MULTISPECIES: stage VI sporulation protein D [Pontibacillus]MCD5323748.1 stage VI sporulation protein D [Pontibacillus sp. HN14]WIF97113.1 stage VI sporulation protein D [Pontibacillus chungwhensis]
MTYEEQNVFSFHLNESLWFKRGQEVEEFMGISLEPDISIQEYGDTVSIRGVIELGGEYFRSSEEGEEEENQILSLRDHASKRTIENVDIHDDGVSEFYHRFPVEISIPKSRIQSMDDVTVSIDSFDYELPEKGQLKLNATVAIHGVSEESRYEEVVEESYEEVDTQPFNFDVTYQEEEEEVLEMDSREEEVEEVVAEVEEQDHAKDAGELEEQEGGRWKYKQTQTLSEFFGKVDEQAQENEEESEESMESYEFEESSEESSEESREEEAPQDARYLTSMFERHDESYAKMRMCIVQEDDTLGSIAHKYKIPPTHLSRVNNLGDEDVSAGQILYIPAKA